MNVKEAKRQVREAFKKDIPFIEECLQEILVEIPKYAAKQKIEFTPGGDTWKFDKLSDFSRSKLIKRLKKLGYKVTEGYNTNITIGWGYKRTLLERIVTCLKSEYLNLKSNIHAFCED